MTGMELYLKFMFTLAVGLTGVGLVMKTLLETLLAEWDPMRHALRWWRQMSHARPGSGAVSAEDILSDLENRRQGRYAPRAPARSIDRRRELLRGLREVEERLPSSAAVEAL